MLVITRRVGQTIVIGDVLRVTVLKIHRQTIELGLEDKFKSICFRNITVSLDHKVQIYEGVTIWFLEKKGQQIHLGIDTSPDMMILREELDKRKQGEGD